MKSSCFAYLIICFLGLAACGDGSAYSQGKDDNNNDIKLTVDKTSLSFDNSGGEATITVKSATQPGVRSDSEWCTTSATKISGAKETVVTVTVATNNTTQARTGSITISCKSEKITVDVAQEAWNSPNMVTTTALTQEMVFEAMGPGWNMGNHMDSINNGVASETAWGNPRCTQATMDGVKAAGFKAVRICTTWEGHIGAAPAYKIEESWLSRVEEIVGYAEKAGLVAILNTHHDESYWLDIAQAYNNADRNNQVKDQIFSFWTQVAQRFKDKGEWLVFESFNEIQDGGWGWSDAFKANPKAQYDVLNEWNQIFVDAVRATGGNNATRWLGIPGYAASPSFTMTGLVLPRDYTSANRLMVAMHDYDPYNYTLRDPLVRRFGHTAESSLRVSSDDEGGLRSTFSQIKAKFIDKGIPVYLGEMGCSRHESADIPYQKYYMEYFCKAAADAGIPMYLWDNGAKGTGPERHAYIDHATGQFVDDLAGELVAIMVKAVTTTDPAYTLQSVYNSAP